jgi:TRAP-type C4-dicarboxylate transport system permease small subunit
MNSPIEKEPCRMTGVDKTIKIFETISVCCLFGISIVIMSQILLRNLFSIGFPWADELSRLLHIALIFLVAPILYRERALFKIDLFVKRLPMKVQFGCRLFSIAVCIGFSIFFMISFTEFMRGSWDVPSPALRMPNLVFFGSIFLGIAGLLGVSIERLIHEIGGRRDKKTP